MSETATRRIADIIAQLSETGLEGLRARLLREPPPLPLTPQRGDFDLNPATKPAEKRDLMPAAVLLPIVARAEPTILFTQRTEHLARHAGQVSFPGGRAHEDDVSLIETALRETQEETGIDPSFVTVAGFLDAYETGTGFAILPVVGLLTEGFALNPHAGEVAHIFEVPLAWLLDEANREMGEREWQGKTRRFHAFRYDGHYIWGATAAMLVNFNERLRGMIRTVILRVLLFLLPFGLFGLYALLLGQRGTAKPVTPWVLLFVIGLGLVAASFVIVGLTEGETTKGAYIPPHMQNGHIVPGHVEPHA